MFFWVAILIVLFILSKLRYNSYIYWVSIIILVIIAGFRDESIGTDTSSYIQAFEAAIDGANWWEKDFGFFIFNEIIASFTHSPNVFLLCLAFLTLFFTSIAFKKYSNNPQQSLFIYYGMYAYLMSLNICRQYLAIAIVLLAYTFIDNRKIISACLIIIASFIHFSAIFTLPLLGISHIKLNNKYFIFISIIISLLIGLMNVVGYIQIFANRYGSYLDQDSQHLYRDDITLLLILSILFSILFLYFYMMSGKNLKNNSLFKIFYIGVLLNNIMFQLDLGTRLSLYFTITQTLFLPYFFSKKYQYTQWIISLYLFAYCIIMLLRGSAEVYPYKSILFT